MEPYKVPLDHVHVGRVLSEDDENFVIEVPKDKRKAFETIAPDAVYVTLIFAQNLDDGKLRTCIPWLGEVEK